MKFPCAISQQPDGTFTIRHAGKDVGTLEVRDATREAAIQKMRDEIRYRLELCPCSGESYQHISIELVEA